MKYFKKVDGERVYLSPMNIEDVEIYTKWMNDFSVTDGLGMSARITSLESEKNYIESLTKHGEYQFAIVDKNTDALIGNGGFSNINHINKTAEVGLFIGEEDMRNKGLGTEALGLLVKYGFEYLNLNNIMLRVYSFNERAFKCYKKCGFKEFGRRHKALPLKNKWYDIVYMEILREDYFK